MVSRPWAAARGDSPRLVFLNLKSSCIHGWINDATFPVIILPDSLLNCFGNGNHLVWSPAGQLIPMAQAPQRRADFAEILLGIAPQKSGRRQTVAKVPGGGLGDNPLGKRAGDGDDQIIISQINLWRARKPPPSGPMPLIFNKSSTNPKMPVVTKAKRGNQV